MYLSVCGYKHVSARGDQTSDGVGWVLGIELGSSVSAVCALDSFCSILFLELCHMELGNRTFDESS